MRTLVCCALAATAAACGAPAAGRSGAPDTPTVLSLTNNDGGGNLRVAPAVAYFIDRVAEVSDNRLRVDWQPGEWATDGREVAAVADGDADLGWVTTRAFDLLGIDAFRPLHAPFLVDSYALQAAVVASSEAGAALAAVRPLGIEPLALLADELMFPASVDRPLDDVASWRGARVWLLESHAYAAAVEALGAEPLNTFESGGDVRLMLQNGEADGLSTMWVFYALGADYQHAPIALPDIPLGVRTVALFANPDTLGALSDDERNWLTAAATDTAAWAATHAADRVPRFAADACTHGARVVTPAADAVDALHALAGPLHEALRSDPATADLMSAIERMAVSILADGEPELPAECLGGGNPTADRPRLEPLLGPGPTGDLPTGTYRYAVPAEAVVPGQESIADGDPIDRTLTWTLGDGEWTLEIRIDDGSQQPITCWGWFAVAAATARFTLQFDADVGHCVPLDWQADWALGPDGALRWSGAVPGVLVPHFRSAEWERIGN